MKTYTAVELAEVIELHGRWLRNDEGGSRANLSGANLYGADLSRANLHGADLRCMGNLNNIKTIQADKWQIGYTHDTMQIGCQRHLIAEWFAFSDNEISNMDTCALAWWKVWKPILQAIIEASPAVPAGFVKVEE